MSAALGHVQMGRLDELLAKREQVANWYNQRIDQIPGVEAPVVVQETTRMSWFVYVVRFAAEINRDLIVKDLEDKRIPVRPYFTPIHLQPYMVERFGYSEGDFPITENLSERGLALPYSSVMTEGQVEYICDQVHLAVERQY
jgi:dTDP-4-amino-4,6-dideoxygalactose transaminase